MTYQNQAFVLVILYCSLLVNIPTMAMFKAKLVLSKPDPKLSAIHACIHYPKESTGQFTNEISNFSFSPCCYETSMYTCHSKVIYHRISAGFLAVWSRAT